MGEIKSIDCGKDLNDRRDRMVRYLRAIADEIDMGLSDYDGLLIVGFEAAGETVDIMPSELTPMQLAWVGHNVVQHAVQCDDDD